MFKFVGRITITLLLFKFIIGYRSLFSWKKAITFKSVLYNTKIEGFDQKNRKENFVEETVGEIGKSSLYISEATKFGIDTVLAVGLLQEGQYDEAEKLARDAMLIGEHTGESDNVYFAYAEGILGDILLKKGSFQEAAEHYHSALKVYERHYRSSTGPEAVQMLAAAMMAGWTLLSDERYKDAIIGCSTALGMAEKMLGPNSPDVATCLFNLGTAYYNTGDIGPRPEAIFLRAIKIYEDAGLFQNTGKVLSSLGNLYFQRNEYEKAEHTYLRVSELNLEGKFHGSEVTPSLKNLGGIYWRQGKLKDALNLYTRALNILEVDPDIGVTHPRCQEVVAIITAVLSDISNKSL